MRARIFSTCVVIHIKHDVFVFKTIATYEKNMAFTCSVISRGMLFLLRRLLVRYWTFACRLDLNEEKDIELYRHHYMFRLFITSYGRSLPLTSR